MTASLKREVKRDVAKILAQVDSFENVSSVSWMLGNSVDDIPLSNWNSTLIGDFFTPTGFVFKLKFKKDERACFPIPLTLCGTRLQVEI